MNRRQRLPLLLLLLVSSLSLFRSTRSQSSCGQATFSNNRAYTLCSNLPRLGASLHWTYHPSNATADIAYRCPQSSSGWVAWALNPVSATMKNSEALIAFPASDGSLTVYSTKLDGYTPTIRNESLGFTVYSREAEFGGGAMTIYASIQVPKNGTRVNQVWQKGNLFDSQGVPAGHPTAGDNILSAGTLDLLSGEAAGSGDSRQHRKNVSGLLF